jgi:hypothetical protein
LAIQPEDIIANTKDYEKSYVDSLEIQIDEFLKNNFKGATVAFEVKTTPSIEVLQELRRRYKNWTLTISHDVNRNTFIKFNARTLRR